eukprot:1069016-Rhodomonas_salina.1
MPAVLPFKLAVLAFMLALLPFMLALLALRLHSLHYVEVASIRAGMKGCDVDYNRLCHREGPRNGRRCQWGEKGGLRYQPMRVLCVVRY